MSEQERMKLSEQERMILSEMDNLPRDQDVSNLPEPRIREDGREVVSCVTLGACDFVNPYGGCVMKKKRPKTPEYIRPREGCAVLEPKVNEPFEVIPRRITRKELLKKIQETFSKSDIEQIGKVNYQIDFNVPDTSRLSLPFFDNKIYQIYPNELWLEKAKDKHTGKQLKLQATGGIFDKAKKTGKWGRILITSYNKDSDTFNGETDDKEKRPLLKMPKLFILFDTENPIVFAKRISEAMKLRQKSEEIIKYHYYLSKIPKSDTTQLPKDRIEKIVTKVTHLPEYDLVSKEIDKEITDSNESYVYQGNKMMFDDLYFKEKSNELCCINLDITPPLIEPVPKFGKEMIYVNNKEFNYRGLLKSYNGNSLQCKSKIIHGIYEIKAIMNQMPKLLHLYKTSFINTIRLEEFLNDERKSFVEFVKTLKIDIDKIKLILSNLQFHDAETPNNVGNENAAADANNFEQEALKEIPIGIDFITNRPKKVRMFSFQEDQEREQATQTFMIKLNHYKTQNLIKKINIMFQDALYDTVVNSLITFVNYFEDNIPETVEVISTNKTKNEYVSLLKKQNRILNIADSQLVIPEESAFNKGTDQPDIDLNTTYEVIDYKTESYLTKDRIPIFNVNLQYKEGDFHYHTNVEQYIQDIRKVFDEGLDKVQKIEQIDFAKKKVYSALKYFDIGKRKKHVNKDHEGNAQNRDGNANNNANNNNNNKNANQMNATDPGALFNEKPQYDPKEEDTAFLADLYERLGNKGLSAKVPLDNYLTLFNQYKADLEINPEEYVIKIDEQATANGTAVHTLREDVLKHQRLYDKITNELSEQVQVSYFLVNCKDVRDSGLDKHEKIKELELKLLAKKAQEIREEVLKEKEEMKKNILKQSKNIEEGADIEKYIEFVPNLLNNMKTTIDSCLEIYSILDEFFMKSQSPDLRSRFALIQSPTEILDTITGAKALLAKQREKFRSALVEGTQQLKTNIESLKTNIANLKTYKTIDQLEKAAAEATAVDKLLNECQDRAKQCNSREVLFDIQLNDYGELNEMAKDVEPFYLIWTSIETFQRMSYTYCNTDIKKLNGVEVQVMNDNVRKNLKQSITKLSGSTGEGYPELIKTATNEKNQSEKFVKISELAVSLTTKGLEDHHWQEMKKVSGIDCTDPEKEVTLDSIQSEIVIEKEMLQKVKHIADKASREYMIKRKLEILNKNWEDLEFGIKGAYTIIGWGDINKQLDEDVQEVQQLEINPFKEFFITQITEWSTSFQNITEILDSLGKFQGKWIQLQPIFESPDIAKSIPRDAALFINADRRFKDTIKELKAEKNVKRFCNIPGGNDRINEANIWLEEVEKGLNEYIEKKKLAFPRFFFLFNEALLKILSETKDLSRVKENLKTIFENIHNIELEDNNKKITKMVSNLGEKIPGKDEVIISGKNIEKWMEDLEYSMFATVHQCMAKALKAYQRPPTEEWIFGHSGQCIIHANQCKWTYQVEEAFEKNTIASYCNEIQERIKLLVTILRKPGTRINGITVFNLLTGEVHNKDITDGFQTGDFNIYSFEWKKQLRYYWEKENEGDDDNMFVKSIQTSFPYGYEYLGNTEILVITPLTDKCYLTLMGALKFNMGGAPAGPAGTGKTESTKDLAKSIAKHCVVYNCSEETDFNAVAAFFKGGAFCGSWICFDEFNRINIEVLSVIASQLIVLFTAKAKNEEKIIFESTPIRIKKTFCVFITMNPDYEGRTALPDNLIALFRPMAMMVPDYRLISEVYLYSSGYGTAKDLAKKIVSTFKLSSEQLSSQSHYDFGMRAVKSVLYAAKKLKINSPETPEDKLLLRALQDVNIPKFLKEDIPLFTNIIKDLFPKTEKPISDMGQLMVRIKENIAHQHLQPHENFIGKIIQLYDTIQVRHGLMIVGPTGGGKSSNWKILQKSISDLHDGNKFFRTHTEVINPKAIRKPELYCEKDPANPTEWINGILPRKVNVINADIKGQDKYWIIFDGPVDTFWIEDMNSVLDDSRRLCLPSSAIIVLNESITMMYEVEDLVHASPATVSRCGMVFMEPSAMGLMPFVDKWLDTRLPNSFVNYTFKNIKQGLRDIFSTCLEENIRFLRKKIKEPCPTTDVNITFSLTKLLECFLERFNEKDGIKIVKEDLDIFYDSMHCVYLFYTIWSIGITCNEEGRAVFNEYIRKFFIAKYPHLENMLPPKEGSVYDYFFDYDHYDQNQWKKWDTILTFPLIDSNAGYTDIIIPTVDSVRYSSVMKMLLENNKHIITTGPTGTGKTINMMSIFSKDLNAKFSQLIINFSAQTTAAQTQNTIGNMLVKKVRGKYAPVNNKPLIIFVDDLNMPKKERFEAQPPIEVLRQWGDYEGWYDIRDKEKPFMAISNLIFAGAMGPPGGGKSFLTNRFMRHFNGISYTELVDSSIKSIFERKVSHFLKLFSTEAQQLIPSIVSSTLILYKSIREKLLPIPKSSHYLFNLRDMSKVLQGVCSASVKHCLKKIDIVRIWMNEMTRSFGDRLICAEDRNWLKEVLEENVLKTKEFGVTEVEEIYNGVDKLIYCDFISGPDRPYVQVTNIKNFITKIEDNLKDFNDEFKSKQMPLVMFGDACDHVARISRIIRQAGGHALLLGVGGSGRQSIARLSSYINYQMDCYSIEVIKGYKLNDFRTNIKDFLKDTVVKEKQRVKNCFLFCDTQIFDEIMLEDINGVLNSGDIPDIYKAEDLEEMKNAVKIELKQKNGAENKTNIMNVYIKRVLVKIHIIIAMSPVGEQFVTRLRMFPSLVNCCTIDWFTEWPEEALLSVAKDILDKRGDGDFKNKFQGVIDTIKYIHKSVETISLRYLNELRRYNYLTPTSFLEFLSGFQKIIGSKTEENDKNVERYLAGLEVLSAADIEIQKIREDIEKKTPELEKISIETDEMIKKAQAQKKIADAVREKATVESETAEKLAVQISNIEQQCRKDLKEAESTLIESLEKIDKIKDSEVTELANYQKITSPKLILSLEMMFTFKNGNAWRKKKEYLEPNPDPKGPPLIRYKLCMQNILGLTSQNIKPFKEYFLSFKTKEAQDNLKNNELENVNLVEKFIKENNITRALVDSASQAVGPIFDFIEGMIFFVHQAIEVVDPQQKRADEAKVEKAKADSAYAKAHHDLVEAEEECATLEKSLNEKRVIKNKLSTTLKDNKIKLSRAEKIVELLASEKIRWKESVDSLKKYADYIIGDCLVAAAAIAYNGPFISTYRDDLEKQWQKKGDSENIPRSEDVSGISVGENKIETGEWNKALLPNDRLSIENGIIMFKTSKWPGMIDPQNQASIFLKRFAPEKKQNAYSFVKNSDPKMVDTVISGVKYGNWVIIENVGLNLDNSLEPILLRQETKGEGFSEIKIGDKTIPYSEEFKLFMITTTSNPHYSPETFAKITIINFAITDIGLEDQMLSELINLEAPDLEAQKNKIITDNFESQKTLLELEDMILDNLSKNKDNIEDTLKSNDLIDILSKSKTKSTDINAKMKISEETKKEIDKKRAVYVPSAKRASGGFFSLIDLSMIDPMYQFSGIQFKDGYKKTIEKGSVNPDQDIRLKDINNAASKALYDFTCRSLFEKDKPLYSFLLCTKIIMGEQENYSEIHPSELRFLLAGPGGDVEVHCPENPTKWISVNDWKNFYSQGYGMNILSDNGKGIHEDFMKNHDTFVPYFESQKNEHTELPSPYNTKLTDFQKLLLIKAVRFDKLINEIAFYVESKGGKEYTEPPTFNLKHSFEDASNKDPLGFVLSTGSDPKNDFQQLAESGNIRTEYVSGGKSMDKVAIKKIEETKLKGGWILLQNCHLAISFMPKLEEEIEKLQDSHSGDVNFRLWLTSMSSNKFSINVLKSSIKITMEPPKGLKLNLQRQFDNIQDAELEGCVKKDLFKSFFFSVCFFHAIVQDRRKFGPIGWNVKYDFTNEDLKVSRLQGNNFLTEYEEIPYKVLNYLIAEINYGGRVTDDKDQRLIKTILSTYGTGNILKGKEYPFSESKIFFCPPPGSRLDYLNYIKTLPQNSSPEVFGGHDNAEIVTAQNEARLLLETTLSMQPRASSGTGKSSDQIVLETLKIIESKTPQPFDYEAIFAKFPTEYTESMNTVLIQEVIRYNVLLFGMKKNIKSLKEALSGKIVMNEELDRIVTSLFNNQVPRIWITSGFLSLKPLMSWIEDLNERIAFLDDWYKNGTPKCFCIPKFSFPQAFLTGTLQNFARKHGCEIDLLSFEFKIMDDITADKVTEKPDDGCYVYGMFLEGARWNYDKHILDSSGNRELYTDVPMIHMKPVVNREPPKTGVYNTPLYKVLSRQGTGSTTGHSTNFVLMVELPTTEEESKWTKAGVAMFLALKQ